MHPLIRVSLSIGAVVFLYYITKEKQSKPIKSKTRVVYPEGADLSYSVLRAEDPKDQETDMGETTKESFLQIFNSFPWDEQITRANELKVQSPTLTLKNSVKKQALAISMAGTPNNKECIVAHIVRDTDGNDMLTVHQTKDMKSVISDIEAFI